MPAGKKTAQAEDTWAVTADQPEQEWLHPTGVQYATLPSFCPTQLSSELGCQLFIQPPGYCPPSSGLRRVAGRLFRQWMW